MNECYSDVFLHEGAIIYLNGVPFDVLDSGYGPLRIKPHQIKIVTDYNAGEEVDITGKPFLPPFKARIKEP